MPTKLKGMTSLEIAIIVAIVLVIAVAVGWYLYTTFVASTSAQARLAISSAEYSGGTLKLVVTNPGPQQVTIQSVYLSGTACTITGTPTLSVGDTATIEAECSGISSATPGVMLPGYVVTTTGATFPFNAIVRAGSGSGGGGGGGAS